MVELEVIIVVEDTAAVGTLMYREYGVVGDTCEFIAASRLDISVLKNLIWKFAPSGNGHGRRPPRLV